jgi:predicted methyltransferase
MRCQAKRLAPTTHSTTTTVVAIMVQEIGSCRKAAAKVKPKNGCSFVPAEVAHFKNDPVGRMQTLAKEPGRENVEVI